jgi:two-component system OmpR family response regulator
MERRERVHQRRTVRPNEQDDGHDHDNGNEQGLDRPAGHCGTSGAGCAAEQPTQSRLKETRTTRSGAVQLRSRYSLYVRILVVEDEARLSRQLSTALVDSGYAVDCAADGARADFLAQTEQYDAVVLDLGLPNVDGLTLLRGWREARLLVPVLVLTARGSWHERVQGIDSGADDYLGKPFQMEEVLARVRALIRRATGQAAPEIRHGAIVLDPRAARVTIDGVPVKLTSHEFRVLSYLMHHRGRVVSQSELTEHIYAEGADRDSNTVEVFIARLRRKLGPSFIETVRGLGYRVLAPADTHEAQT